MQVHHGKERKSFDSNNEFRWIRKEKLAEVRGTSSIQKDLGIMPIGNETKITKTINLVPVQTRSMNSRSNSSGPKERTNYDTRGKQSSIEVGHLLKYNQEKGIWDVGGWKHKKIKSKKIFTKESNQEWLNIIALIQSWANEIENLYEESPKVFSTGNKLTELRALNRDPYDIRN